MCTYIPRSSGPQTVTLGNVIPPTGGWLACVTQSRGASVHYSVPPSAQRCNVALCCLSPNRPHLPTHPPTHPQGLKSEPRKQQSSDSKARPRVSNLAHFPLTTLRPLGALAAFHMSHGSGSSPALLDSLLSPSPLFLLPCLSFFLLPLTLLG